MNNGYVGTVEGTDAYVAIVVADKTVLAYVCDGANQIAEAFLVHRRRCHFL